MEYIFSAVIVVILIISVVVHEYAHGKVSLLFGDTTAMDQGRLTLNPIKHLDPVGSILLPLFLVIMNTGFVIGWAKPVPINPDNYLNKRLGWILTSLAGPTTNYLIAIVSLIILIVINSFLSSTDVILIIKVIIWYFFAINFILGSFNVIPLPPLDGFWVIINLLPDVTRDKVINLVSKYYPLFMIITAVIAVLVSRYTFLPILNYLVDMLGE